MELRRPTTIRSKGRDIYLRAGAKVEPIAIEAMTEPT
ncbi:hypothetical protein ES703_114430 [subsurface metagenome]